MEKSVTAFRGTREPFDDATMLAGQHRLDREQSFQQQKAST